MIGRVAISVAHLRNRIRSKAAKAVQDGFSLLQVLTADAVAAATTASNRSIAATSANGASVQFSESADKFPSDMDQAADDLLTRYDLAVASLSVTETDNDSSQANAIASEMLAGCVSIRSFSPDFSMLGVNR